MIASHFLINCKNCAIPIITKTKCKFIYCVLQKLLKDKDEETAISQVEQQGKLNITTFRFSHYLLCVCVYVCHSMCIEVTGKVFGEIKRICLDINRYKTSSWHIIKILTDN